MTASQVVSTVLLAAAYTVTGQALHTHTGTGR